jgi:membrane protease YdiL (CAAX protease family)
LKKPEVWGGVLGAFSIAVATAYFAYPQQGAKIAMDQKMIIPTPLVALPVAVGEESLFRGLLQSFIAENLNPTAGIIISSLAFGAAHIPNARLIEDKSQRWRYYTFSLPLITGIGGYLGWLTHKNHSLQESVAVHAWYDFVLFSISAVANQAAATGRPGFAFALPF